MLTKRAKRDQLTEGFLRQAHESVRRNLGGATLGRVAMDDLRRDLQAEEVPVRVALSFLEQAALLRHWPDLPRSVSLCQKHSALKTDADWISFCRAARLQPGQRVQRDLLAIANSPTDGGTGQTTAQQGQLDLRNLEERVLAWVEEGLVDYRPSARDWLLEVLPEPTDAQQRMRSLLEQYEQIQRQRIAEIVSYANTRRCRHGHISAYLGGRRIERCQSCDNCLPSSRQEPREDLPDLCRQLRTILQAAARGWGQHNLVCLLRGNRRASEAARTAVEFGALSFRSEGAVKNMIEDLIISSCLQKRQLKHGGIMVELSPAGRRALSDPAVLHDLAATPIEATASSAKPQLLPKLSVQPEDTEPVPDEDPVFQRLRAWQLEKAREARLPAFFIAHSALLRAIAAARPRDEAELRGIKGIGPHKLEKYGAELLALIRESRKEGSHL
jgi:hypothetical protein